jgi:formylglycine-generating enzyme required for sulfatase activity
MDLSIERWDGVTSAEREAIARRLAMQLPSGFTFHATRPYRLGERQHHVALYQKDNATFALVPGSAVSLGYDAVRPWEPNPDELESWQRTAEEYGIAKALQEYIAEVTLRLRRVELPPLLIETTAGELGWEAIGVEDPEVQEILRQYGTQSQVEVSRGDARTRVRRGSEGSIITERSLSRTHAELAAQLRATGFRFPTSDEWEYACGGGTPTLFRWGDHVPCDCYPTDVSPAEAAWRRQWVLSAGKLEYPAEAFPSNWHHHRRPNGFGLFIASDPYKYELVAEIGITRGGDGGCTICGGAGFFIGWLTLATAYFEEHSCKHDPTEPISHGYTVGRRVLDLQ